MTKFVLCSGGCRVFCVLSRCKSHRAVPIRNKINSKRLDCYLLYASGMLVFVEECALDELNLLQGKFSRKRIVRFNSFCFLFFICLKRVPIMWDAMQV